MRIIFLLLMPLCCVARVDSIPDLDTVRIGDALPAIVKTDLDGVSMSWKTYEVLNKFVAVQDKEVMYYRQQWEYCRESQGWADVEIEERKKIAQHYKDRSIMYKDSYQQLTEDFTQLHLMLQEKDKIILAESRRSTWRGAAIGGATGVVVGLITAFIILN